MLLSKQLFFGGLDFTFACRRSLGLWAEAKLSNCLVPAAHLGHLAPAPLGQQGRGRGQTQLLLHGHALHTLADLLQSRQEVRKASLNTTGLYNCNADLKYPRNNYSNICQILHIWQYNFPRTPHVRQLVGRSVFHNTLKR